MAAKSDSYYNSLLWNSSQGKGREGYSCANITQVSMGLREQAAESLRKARTT